MNKRMRKKFFKKKTGVNPPGWLNYKAPVFHSLTGWAWVGREKYMEQCEQKKRAWRVGKFSIAISERRKNERRKKNSW